mgnify:CR=1 FL=1
MSEQEYTNDAEHIAHLTKILSDAGQMAETYRKMAGDAIKAGERQRTALQLVKNFLDSNEYQYSSITAGCYEAVHAALAQEPT